MATATKRYEVVDFADSLPDFSKLRAQQLPEQRANTHIGEIITLPSNRAATRRIVSVLGMVERLVHKPGE